MNKVSIILPNYNSHKFIRKTLNSIITQTFRDWELIVVDDDSDEKTVKILKTFKKNKKIKIFFLKKNKGAAYCRNLAIRKSKSKYLAFIDSDDIWKKNKLYDQIKFMEKNKYFFSYTHYYTFKENSNIYKKIKVPNKINFNYFIKNTSIATSTMIIKKSILNNINFPKTKICEDYYFKCRILKKIDYAYCFPRYLSYYQIRKKSLQSNKLRNIYWIWKINNNLNKLNFFDNLISLFSISLNSIRKYGFK